ncbi:MAG: hypothetical protein Q9183_000922 [Haloplaca sp. 2 TL-2023]
MEPESYQKFGRGGAGNYYSKQDIKEVQKRAAEDVEAQSTTAAEFHASDAKQPEYVHSGRGGAGNYSSPLPNELERRRSIDLKPTTREVTVPEGGFYGRGGAGNLRASEGSSKEEAEGQASETQKAGHHLAVEDVEKGLRAPEKAHLAKE